MARSKLEGHRPGCTKPCIRRTLNPVEWGLSSRFTPARIPQQTGFRLLSMPHSLEARIREVARQAWWLMLGRALAWSFVWVTLTGCLLGLADYSFRYPGRFPRVIAFSVWVGVSVWTCWKYLLPVFSWSGDPVVIAQRVERQFPQLGDRLSMAIAFLAERAAGRATGSAELRSVLVEDVSRQVAALRLTSSLDPSGLWRGLGVGLVTVAILGCLVGLDHESARFALWRLVTPWRPEMWPRMHRLSWLDAPQRLPVGADFEAVLTDLRGSLPTDARFESRVEGDLRSQIQPLAVQADYARVRLERVQRSFLFRATGGDDDTMAWQHVEVVQRPRLKALRALVTPPPYSGLSPSESTGEIRALAGSTLRVVAHVDQPLRKVKLIADFPAPDTFSWSHEDRRLEVPGIESAGAWNLNQSGEFRFAWEDEQGTSSESTERFVVTVLPDAVPTATLEQPPSEAMFTPQAIVPIRITARDDFALQQVTVRHGEESWTFYERTEPPRRTALEAAPDVQVVTAAWDLTRHEFDVGQVIEADVVVFDFLKQQGQSRPIRLQIVSPADIQQQVAGLQDELILRLQQARRAQALGWERTQTWLHQSAATENWGQVEFDLLQGNEQHQRHVRRLLESPDGATALATKIVETIRVNRLESAEWVQRVERLSSEMVALQQGPLATTERQLHRAVEWLREDLNRPAAERQPAAIWTAIEPQLKQAASAQQDTIATLDRWIDALLQWDRLEQFSREVQTLLETQQGLVTKTQRIDTLGKAVDQLTAGERLALEQLADRQAELAERLERLTERMRDAQQTASATDTDFQSNLAEVLAQAEQGGAAAASREATRHLRENRIGEAATFQNEALQGLQDLLTAFPHSSDRGTALRDSLEPLAKQQAVIVQRLENLAEIFKLAGRSPQPTVFAQAHQLATEQERVIEAVGRLENRFGAAQTVVGLALHETREQMEKVAHGLRVSRIDSEVQEAGRVALDRLRLLIQALDQEHADIAPPDPNLPASGTSPETLQKRVISRTDLEMLKLWQDQLRQRTAELESLRTTSVVSIEVVRRLAAEQQKLAQTAARLAAGSASGVSLETPQAIESRNTFDDLDAALRAVDLPGFSDPLVPTIGSPEAGMGPTDQPPTGPPARSTAPEALQGREAGPAASLPTDSPSTPSPQAPSPEPEQAIPSQTTVDPTVDRSSATRSSPMSSGSPVEPVKSDGAATPAQPDQPRDPSLTKPNPAFDLAKVPGIDSRRAAQPTSVEPAALAREDVAREDVAREDVAREDVAREDVGNEAEDPLDVIRREMLAIVDRLQSDDTSLATQLAQQRVIDRLSALLAGNQPRPSAAPSPSTESPDQSTETATQPGAGKAANPRKSGRANESARTTGMALDAPRGWGRLWGNLPDRIRDQILTPDREQFLPAYEDLIKRYYERLAQEEPSRR